MSKAAIFCPHEDIPSLIDPNLSSLDFLGSLKEGRFQLACELNAKEISSRIAVDDEAGIKLRTLFDESKLKALDKTVYLTKRPSSIALPTAQRYSGARNEDVVAFIVSQVAVSDRNALEAWIHKVGLLDLDIRHDHLGHLFTLIDSDPVKDLSTGTLKKLMVHKQHPSTRLYIQDPYFFNSFTTAEQVSDLLLALMGKHTITLKDVVILSNVRPKTTDSRDEVELRTRWKQIRRDLNKKGIPIRFFNISDLHRTKYHDRFIFTDNFVIDLKNSLTPVPKSGTQTSVTWLGRFAKNSPRWINEDKLWIAKIEELHFRELI